tara:strand:+ start:828 stop:1658 length:831 start_codon:yes stop_codon:yes gene_type:complete
MVLDVGGGTACAAAVHDGYVLSKPLKKSGLAGDMLTELSLKSVGLHEPVPAIRPVYSLKSAEEEKKAHASYHKYHQLQVLREAKESLCRCSMHAPTEAYPLNADTWEHEMPDKSMLDMAWERFHLPELYFTPSLFKGPVAGCKKAPWLNTAAPSAGAAEVTGMVPEGILGLPEMVAEAIRLCDTDTRRELWGSVVVCGGGSLLPGLTERLHARLNQLVPQMQMKVKLIAPTTPQERRFAVWIGGSILASLGSFQQLWMSKQEYDEQGAQGILRKCP